MTLRTLDLFTGIGGFTHALAGIARTVAFCEIDKNAVGVLHRRMESGVRCL